MNDAGILVLPNVLDPEVFSQNHDNSTFRDDLNLFIQLSKVLDSKKDRIIKNKRLYQLESKIHGGNVAATRLCIKNTFEWSNAKILLEDAFPGIIRRNLEWMENIFDKFEKWGWTYWLFNKVKSISSIYVDIIKDTFLMVSVLLIIGGPTSLLYFPKKLTSVVVYCFLVTIIMPLICSSILHTQRKLNDHENIPFWRKLLAYAIGITLSPIRPLLLAEAFEENKSQRKQMIKFNSKREIVLGLNKKGRKLRKAYSEFIKVDLGLEVMFQLAGQVK